ncbi:MAG: trypsin-like peptidase domain-containing protein, partial [Opitutaceae bacterium]
TDGARISAEVLLKDPALDLIVLRADVEAWRASGGDDLPVIDLADAGEAELMDEIVVIGQAGPALGREALGALPGIMIKTTKPRVIYRPSFAQKGGPAFTLDGHVLGIGAQLVYREKLTKDIVVIPAEDVAELVRQAMEAPLPAETAASVEKAEK